MRVPEWFAHQLDVEFRGRFRVRWSNARHCFVIDEVTGRGTAMAPMRFYRKVQRLRPDLREEYLFRMAHGTTPYVEVYPGTRASCPACLSDVSLKTHTWEFAHCRACGKDFKAVHYELGWMLLEQLRYNDFERGGDERQVEEMDRANEAKEKGEVRENRNVLEAVVKDNWNQIAGIKSVAVGG